MNDDTLKQILAILIAAIFPHKLAEPCRHLMILRRYFCAHEIPSIYFTLAPYQINCGYCESGVIISPITAASARRINLTQTKKYAAT